jgi:hypothetical protein
VPHPNGASIPRKYWASASAASTRPRKPASCWPGARHRLPTPTRTTDLLPPRRGTSPPHGAIQLWAQQSRRPVLRNRRATTSMSRSLSH